MNKLSFLFLLLSTTLISSTLVVSSIGDTCKNAVNNALISAVEQSSGVMLKSNSKVIDDELYEEIYSSTDGLIESYQKLNTTFNHNECEVTLRVVVSNKKINNFINDKKAMRLWQKVNFKNRRVYIHNVSSIDKQNTLAIKTIVKDIEDRLKEKSFNVVKKNNSLTSVILEVDFNYNVIDTDDDMKIIYANASFQVLDKKTKQVFATSESRNKALTTQHRIKKTLQKSAKKISKKALPHLISKIVNNFSIGSIQ